MTNDEAIAWLLAEWLANGEWEAEAESKEEE